MVVSADWLLLGAHGTSASAEGLFDGKPLGLVQSQPAGDKTPWANSPGPGGIGSSSAGYP